MEQLPKVSVIIPFYSGLAWLYEAVESVLEQDYPDLEIIVINDGSQEDLSEFAAYYRNRLVVLKQENRGPAAARNAGIDKASGKYVAFLDSDDLWIQGKLRAQIQDMERHDAIWGQHSFERFWENSRMVKAIDTSNCRGDVFRECFISFPIATDCLVIRLEELNRFHIRYPEEMRYGEDISLYQQLASNWPLHYTEGIYARIRVHGTNAGFSARVQLQYRASVWNEIRKNSATKKRLPIFARAGLWMAYYAAKPLNKMRPEKAPEFVAKLLYIIPYFCLKIAKYTL